MRSKWNKDRLERDHEGWVEMLLLPIGEGDPTSSQVDPSLLGIGQNSEHVGMSLSKLMHPVGNVGKTFCIHDNVVKPFLPKRESKKIS